MIEPTAEKIIAKYIRKGNMSRCLRDILPSSGLTKEQREQVADIVHDVVRWKKLYDYLLNEQGKQKNPEQYVRFAVEKIQDNSKVTSFEYRYSCSPYVAQLLKKKPQWADYLNESPPTTLCVNNNTSSIHNITRILQSEKLPVKQGHLPTAILSASIARYSSVIQSYYAHVQDEASQLISLLAVEQGDTIMDFCAGNGGKSLAMASLTKNEKKLYAYEINIKKREVLKQRCNDYVASVEVCDHVPSTMFDVVLVDAPCTGIGAARRNPEVKYVQESGEFPSLQLRILNEAMHYVRPGGFLLYSVCTITPEETQHVTETFSETHNMSLLPLKNSNHVDLLETHRFGAYTHVPDGDLFFVCLFQVSEKQT